VPMQPRREREELREETVFHVTNRGDSLMSEERWEVRRPVSMGVNEELEDAGVVSVVLGSRELELEEEGVEEPLDERSERRWRVGFLRAVVKNFEGSSASSPSSSSSSPSETSSPFGYSAHAVWT